MPDYYTDATYAHDPFEDMDPDACDLDIATDPVMATRKVLIQAAHDRLPPPDMDVVPCDEEDDEDVLDDVLGDDGGAFPVLARLYSRFDETTPAPKYVRMDDAEGYDDFVRRKPFLELDRRVRELRAAHEQHVANSGHGGSEARLSAWDSILGEADEIEQAQEDGGGEGEIIDASFEPAVADKVTCWIEDGSICCSMRLPGADGNAWIATTATPLDEHMDDAVRYIERSGVNPVDVMGEVRNMALRFGAGSLPPQIAAATPALLAAHAAAGGGSSVHKIVPATDPSLVALMSLCQLVQQGSPQARAEWNQLTAIATTGGHAELARAMLDAQNQLALAQAIKAT